MNDRRDTLPILDRITINTPCAANWDQMEGDDRVRFCGLCQKNVFNLSVMSAEEATTLLHEEPTLCARIYLRPDGTVVSGACPAQLAAAKPSQTRWQFSLASLMILFAVVAVVCPAAPWIGEKLRPMWDRLIGAPQISPLMGDVCIAPPMQPGLGRVGPITKSANPDVPGE